MLTNNEVIAPIFNISAEDEQDLWGADKTIWFKKLSTKELQELVNTDQYQLKDIAQGGIGNCYFLAALSAIVDRDPGLLKNMITLGRDKEGNLRVNVTLYAEDGSPRIYSMPPTVTRGYTVGTVNYHKKPWVEILEKAYTFHRLTHLKSKPTQEEFERAQHLLKQDESDWSEEDSNLVKRYRETREYLASLSSGSPAEVFKTLLGTSATREKLGQPFLLTDAFCLMNDAYDVVADERQLRNLKTSIRECFRNSFGIEELNNDWLEQKAQQLVALFKERERLSPKRKIYCHELEPLIEWLELCVNELKQMATEKLPEQYLLGEQTLNSLKLFLQQDNLPIRSPLSLKEFHLVFLMTNLLANNQFITLSTGPRKDYQNHPLSRVIAMSEDSGHSYQCLGLWLEGDELFLHLRNPWGKGQIDYRRDLDGELLRNEDGELMPFIIPEKKKHSSFMSFFEGLVISEVDDMEEPDRINLFVNLSDEKMQEQQESGGVFYLSLHDVARYFTDVDFTNKPEGFPYSETAQPKISFQQ
ncbi:MULTISPECIES: C2 family cysteine protease [unclassified Legionella]|uniref:C2 family cysteine protease n=1 Tax=unclassified Legionella TaxID=2622702 RepID=UPI001E5B36E6|nr:C2 family cysteine protease [Legionella sp. 31fI33]MCC5013547.1 hypothetical protein [Legionella sp. 31fI33]